MVEHFAQLSEYFMITAEFSSVVAEKSPNLFDLEIEKLSTHIRQLKYTRREKTYPIFQFTKVINFRHLLYNFFYKSSLVNL